MSDNEDWPWAICIAVVVVAIVAGICFAVYRTSHESTQREVQCVKYGGSYVKVANGSKMECRK